MLVFKLAWRSFVRHRRRALITSMAIALGLTMLIAFTGLAIDAHERMATMGIRLGGGHVVVQGRGFQKDQTLDDVVSDPAAVARVAGAVRGVQAVAQRVTSSGLLTSGELSTAVVVAGVEPGIEPRISDIAAADVRTAGGYLRTRAQLPFPSDPADIYIGTNLARSLDVAVGDRVVLTVSPAHAARPAAAAYRVRGIFHTGVAELDGFYAQIPLAEAQKQLDLGDAVTQVAVFLDDLRGTERVTRELREGLDTDALEVLPWQEALRELYEAIVLDDAGLYLMHGIVFLIVAIGIFNTVTMSVVERTRELGVQLAIGTSGRRLFATILAEAAIMGAVACLAGLALGLGIHEVLAHHGLDITAIYGQDFEFAGIAFKGTIYSTLYAPQVARWVGAVFSLVLLSSLYPAFRATRLRPVEAMRHV